MISIDAPKKKFEDFLADKGNRRIIFSGAFGTGKTWFLKKFFEDKKDYYFIRLAPVNYSVSKNEDIFELIKFDILLQILKESLIPEEIGLSEIGLLRTLSLLDPEKGIQGILEKISHTNHDISRHSIKQIENLLDESTVKQGNNLKKLRQFIDIHSKQSGSPKEQDAITKLIYCLISILGKPEKENESGKQTVLIIDDLDRIDPEHVFRILNVFAAHFDLDENANKFGFDRVIVVCDIQNVRRMFRTRYGQDTDFSGYIDKFYSRRVFHFDNRKAVEEAVSGILCSVEIEPRANDFTINYENQIDHRFLVFVFHSLLRVGAINLRAIWRMSQHPFKFDVKQLLPGTFQFYPSIGLFEFLAEKMGDAESLREGLQRCVLAKIGYEVSDKYDPLNKDKLGLIMPILVYKNSKSSIYKLPGSDEEIKYEPVTTKRTVYTNVRSVTKNDTETTPDIFPYMVEAVEVLQRLGHLR